MRVQNRIYSRK